MQTNKKKPRLRFAAIGTDARISFAAIQTPTGDGQAVSPSPSLTIGTLKAYPLVWNKLSSDRGGYAVRLVKGSAVFQTPTLALYNHHFGRLLGNTAAGTMRINPPDDYGQSVEIDLPDTSDGRDVATLIARGDIKGMSFSMMNGFEESFATVEDNGQNIVNATRYIVDEVSILVDPAFVDTTVELLDDDDKDDEEDTEEDLAPTEATAGIAGYANLKKESAEQLVKWNRYRLYLLNR